MQNQYVTPDDGNKNNAVVAGSHSQSVKTKDGSVVLGGKTNTGTESLSRDEFLKEKERLLADFKSMKAAREEAAGNAGASSSNAASGAGSSSVSGSSNTGSGAGSSSVNGNKNGGITKLFG